ncbi:hypothetical protein FRB94_009504 [Tulasnella sp. JGI-2019a]|nr:hypothetical protein FRB94_009504 [Tulasnella sp. JGI-2019a]KAG9003147.1 hypothetical protein FRB93_011227 [Tulasnella sp. JGI-2019a]
MSSSTQYQQFSTPGSPGRVPQPRRMTASSGRVPPPAMPLGLPEPTSNRHRDSRPRSRSPLRRGHSFDGEDNSDDEDEEDDHYVDARSSSARGDSSTYPTPAGTPAISKVASAFLRVGSLVGSSIHSSASESQYGQPLRSATSPYPQSPSSVLSRLTDAELEAEALREKENSRLEAERILIQEAEDRRRADERILSRIRTNNSHLEAPSSPAHPPDEISDFAPVTPRKEDGGGGSWMSGLMKKLTPTKDKDLTPAQQIINETKAREKKEEKERKSTEKQRSGDWPAAPKAKLSDPTYLSLHQSQPSTATTPSTSPAGSRLAPSNYSNGPSPMMRGQASSGPSTPTPASRVHGPPGGSPLLGTSPGGEKEPTPLYAVFNQAGTLDIPATLITVTRRFEKLEKWTVSHVRALEDRMKDVEKYLIERESGEQKSNDIALRAELSVLTTEIARVHILLDDLRSDMPQYQSQAKTSTNNQAAGPSQKKTEPQPKSEEPFIKSPSPMPATPSSRVPEPVSTTKTTGVRSLPQLPQHTTQSAFSGRPTAPATNEPVSSPPIAASTPPPPPPPPPPPSRTPPAAVRSPPTTPKSPPSQQALVGKSSRSRLPYPSGDYTSSSSRPGSPDDMSGLGSPPRFNDVGMTSHSPRSGSDSSYVIPERYRSPSPPPQLAPPKTPNNAGARAVSASPSPTPRKRYTVALSGRDDGGGSGFPSPNTATRGDGEVQTALFSGMDSPSGTGSRAQSPETETFESGYTAFGGLLNGGRTGHGRDTSDATAVPPDREGNKSPDPTIGLTPITLTRLASPPPTSPKTPAGTGLGVSPNGARSRPGSSYSMHSLSPSLKSVQSTTNTPVVQNDTGSRVVSSRARAQSTYLGNDNSQASGATSTGSPRPAHRRSQSIAPGSGRNGDNNGDTIPAQNSGYQSNASSSKRGATLHTPSGQPFVDPLIIKKKSKDPMRVTSPNGARNANGTKIPFGQLVAFFDGGEKAP